MKTFALALIAAGALTLSACSDDSQPLEAPLADRVENREPPAQAADPIAKIAIEGGFNELVSALVHVDTELNAGLVNLFMANNTGPFTVFAPTDEAFRELYAILTPILQAQITSITQVPAEVVLSVLKYHVVDGRRPSPVVLPKSGERWLPTLQGENFWVTSGGMIRDGLGLRATIVAPDVRATNGVIHVIDKVILPPSVVAALTSD